MEPAKHVLIVDPICKRIFDSLAKRKPDIFKKLQKQILKILKEPILGKPLRYNLRNFRRIHVDSFVLIYEVWGSEIRVVDFDHHDRVYAKYR